MRYEPAPVIALQSVYPVPRRTIRRNQPNLQHLQRCKAFIARTLTDFAFQWRHVLGGRYNNSTFRRFANAVIRIATLDLTVKEEASAFHGLHGPLVLIKDLPEWDPASGHIVKVGDTSIAICQHIPHAVKLIRKDFMEQPLSTTIPTDSNLTYLILSVRELVLCRINCEVERYTEPERLFDRMLPPSDEAIDLLLQATQTRPSMPPLRQFPVELQDAVLDSIQVNSFGLVRSALSATLHKQHRMVHKVLSLSSNVITYWAFYLHACRINSIDSP